MNKTNSTRDLVAGYIGLANVLEDEVERLQSENEQLQLQLTAKETTCNGTYIDINTHYRDIKKLQAENAHLKAERDKAVEDLKMCNQENGTCYACKYQDKERLTCTEPNPGKSCNEDDKWQWRGLEESESC